MIAVVNRGDAVALSAGGRPPALFTSTSSRPKRSTIAATTRVDLVGVADVGLDEHRVAAVRGGQRLGFVPAADHDVGAGARGTAPRCRARRRGSRR